MERKVITESQLINIVEERGVAASPWKKEIDSIAMYIRKRVMEETNGENNGEVINFIVPDNISDVFPFLVDFQVKVEARPAIFNIYSGGGSFGGRDDSFKSIKVPDWDYKKGQIFFRPSVGKLGHAMMEIICFYNNNGKVWLNSILTSFYHEINHAYDGWMSVSRDRNFNRFNKSGEKGYLGNTLEDKFRWIGMCIYRLFSETEYNALVASVFGNLQGIDSRLSTFKDDYKKTQAYWIYKNIKENLQNEIDNLSIEDARFILNEMRSNEISLNMKKNTLSSFKIAFMSKANRLLNELLHDIGRVASFYYDKKHEEEIDNNGQPISVK